MATVLIEVGSIDIDAIKDQHPLAQVVEKHVALKRRSGLLEGLCPFHSERTPSFKVYEKDQRFHCFGCGAHGDVFDFLRETQGLELREAAEFLTGGIALPPISAERIEELRLKQAAFEEEERQRRLKAIAQATERWVAADPHFFDHPYLEAKKIQPHGTRREGDLLLIPLIGDDNKIQTLQSIDKNGRKLFVNSAPMSGGLFVIGGKVARAAGPVILAEGFATAASLHEATGCVTVCSFNAGNMPKVAARLKDRYPTKDYIVAGDDDRGKKRNVGREAAIEAAEILGCRAVLPAFASDEGTDFNDMASAYGPEAVKALVLDGERPADAVESPEQQPLIKAIDAFDFLEAEIPVRPWIVPGILLSRHTHMLVAPGGSGKSLFTLQLSIMLATGQPWGEWVPRRRCRSLIVNVEDDIDEQRRRLAAARVIMAPDAEKLKGMIRLAEEPESIVIARVDPQRKSVVSTPIVAELRKYIADNDIDVLFVDPFAETFEGDENSNSEVKWAMKVWRDDIARPTGCAVYLVHHTVKYASGGAGNADVIRGAGAIVNSTRISSTLFTMTEEESKALGVPVEDRNHYIRFDDAKANQTLKSGTARWFEKVGVTIGNGGGFSEPDIVGALRPWAPPDAFSGLSNQDIRNALLLIDRGLEDAESKASGVLFTHRTNTKEGTKSERWAGRPIMAALGVSEERAKLILKEWLGNGMLSEGEFYDPLRREDRKGLFVSKQHLESLL